MKVLKVIGVIIVVLILGYITVAALSSKEVIVERTTTVNLPVEKVFALANDFNFYAKWNEWSKMDQNSEHGIEGKGYDVGDVWNWSGDTVGVGSMTKTAFVPNESIENTINFESPWTGNAKDLWFFEATEEGTKITWQFKQDMDFFMRPIAQTMMDAMIGATMQKGITRFGELALTEPTSNNLTFEMAELPAMHYIGIEANNVTVSELSAVMDQLYEKLGEYLGQKSITPTGGAISITTDWNEEAGQCSLIAAFPVTEGTEGNGDNIIAGDLEAMQTIHAMHNGTYEDLVNTHMAIDEYLKANQIEMKYPVVEVYLNNPQDVSPEELKTAIYYPAN